MTRNMALRQNKNKKCIILSAAFCGFPGTSLNSRVEFSSDSLTTGTFAAYSCDDGYLLLGSKSRYCLDEGKWSGSLPVCGKYIACECGGGHSTLRRPDR